MRCTVEHDNSQRDILIFGAPFFLALCFVFLYLPQPGASFILFSIPIFAAIAYALLSWHAGKQMQLRLDNSVFFAGDSITGTVILHLDTEKKARGLYLEFYGVQGAGESAQTVFGKKHLLQPARTYRKGEAFRFSIPMPAEVRHILDATAPANAKEKNAVYYMEEPRWFIKAYLDLTNEIDISRIMEVKIASGKKDSKNISPFASPQISAASAEANNNIRLVMILIFFSMFALFALFALFAIGPVLIPFFNFIMADEKGAAPDGSAFKQGETVYSPPAYATILDCKPEITIYGGDERIIWSIVGPLISGNNLSYYDSRDRPLILKFNDKGAIPMTAFALKWYAKANVTTPCTISLDGESNRIWISSDSGTAAEYSPQTVESDVSPFLPRGKSFHATYTATIQSGSITGISDLQAQSRQYLGYKASGTASPSRKNASRAMVSIHGFVSVDGIPYVIPMGGYVSMISDSNGNISPAGIILQIEPNISIREGYTQPIDVYMDLEIYDGYATPSNYRLEK